MSNHPTISKIQEYVQLGGLFNPEMMEHEKVRDLIIECREVIAGLEAKNMELVEQRDTAIRFNASSLEQLKTLKSDYDKLKIVNKFLKKDVARYYEMGLKLQQSVDRTHPELNRENDRLKSIAVFGLRFIGKILNELPTRRDWLDPDLEREMRAYKTQAEAELLATHPEIPDNSKGNL